MTWEGMVEAQNALLISHTGVTHGYSPGCTPITGWPHGGGCCQHLLGDRPDVRTDPRAHPQDAGCRPRLVAVFPWCYKCWWPSPRLCLPTSPNICASSRAASEIWRYLWPFWRRGNLTPSVAVFDAHTLPHSRFSYQKPSSFSSSWLYA